MRPWIKFYPTDWLQGTTREELNEEERGVWVDLLAMAGSGRFDGIVAAGKRDDNYIGYGIPRLAGLLNRNQDTLYNILQKLQRVEKIKIYEVDLEGTKSYWMEIVNWNKYQSEYSRIKKYIKAPEEYVVLAEKLWDAVKSMHPKDKKPDINKWAFEIDLMVRTDKRDLKDIRNVIEWLPTDFKPSEVKWKGWGNVIRSASNLREHFAQLIEKLQQPASATNEADNKEKIMEHERFLRNNYGNKVIDGYLRQGIGILDILKAMKEEPDYEQ